MSVFIRRFTTDPGQEVFLEIEAVNILDLEPPGSINGIATGTALLVGEFDDGEFNTPTQVTSSVDLITKMGGFGYVYGGIVANNPCARSRKADGAVDAEYWNGNAMVALNGKKFGALIACRVDTSVGECEFTRCAYLTGGSFFSYPVATSGDQIDITGDVTNWLPTFTGVPANIASAVGVYPTLFAGGEQMTIQLWVGGVPQPPVTVTFQVTDQLQVDVIARINAAMGYVCASNAGGGVTDLDGRIRGTDDAIAVTAVDVAVTAAVGFIVATAQGTGNVANLAQVKPSEIDAIVNAASGGDVRVRQLDSGQLRMEYVGAPATGVLAIDGAGAAGIAFGFVESSEIARAAAWQDRSTPIGIPNPGTAGVALGVALPTAPNDVLAVGAGVYPTLFVGGEYIDFTVQGQPTVRVEFAAADQTIAAVVARINAAMGYAAAQIITGSVTTFALAGPGTNDTTIPAGTVVKNAAGVEWVTMQTQAVDADEPGPYSIKVRHANDNGAGASTALLTVTSFGRVPQNSAWVVTNPVGLSAALTESALDAAYKAALDSTLDPSSVASVANLVWSARQSNAVRAFLRENALAASEQGLYGRMTVVRPPLGTTTRAMAQNGASQPGVGAYRDQRVIYAFPGVQTFMPAIATRGVSGGDGFTADGIIDVGADGFVVSVCSQLPPEENPGQLTGYTTGALGIEAGNPDVQSMTIADYKAFRAAGICAPRMDSGALIFQSGVTSVNPLVQSAYRNIARRRMADFIQDSLSLRLKNFGKKLSTPGRRAAIVSEIRAFMNQLLSPGNAAGQRVDGFKLDPVSGNTPETLALGIFRIILNVRTLASLDAIVLQTTIGEQVDVSEAA